MTADLSKSKRVAVIDDDGSVRNAMCDLIALLGHTADTFASAEEFLECGWLDEISCLVTDVQMPGMNGVQLYDRLLADGYRTPVIFVTAFPQEGIRDRLLKDGAVAYLTKPLREEYFIACLDGALGKARDQTMT